MHKPLCLFSQVWRLMPRFRGYQQQDAQEFFSKFIDHLNLELSVGGPAHAAQSPPSSDGEEKVSRNIFATDDGGTTDATLFPTSTFLADTLQGAHCTEIRCNVCNNISATPQKFWSLNLSLASHKKVSAPLAIRRSARSARRSRAAGNESPEGPVPDLVDLLKETTAIEHLVNDNCYFCEECNKKCEATKQTRLHHVPDVLVVGSVACGASRVLLSHIRRTMQIHVNRAFWFPNGGKHKITTHVNFPLENLDLKPFCTEAAVQQAEAGYVADRIDVAVCCGVGL